MTKIYLKGIAREYPGKPNIKVLKNISLTIESGELIVFIGSSGCGKSSLLRIIAGLDQPSAGQVHFDGQCMNKVAPAQRGVGMVFQSYALYPHMTVHQNLAFGLKQSLKKIELEKRIQAVADKLEISTLLLKKPSQLSGGQQQRVAVARCIVQRPRVFLLDEPLSNLDADLRRKTRIEIRKLHKELKTTTVLVTHDQAEAMTVADKIAVFAPLKDSLDSNLQQYARPEEIYHNPANRFVAGFLSEAGINILPAVVVSKNLQHLCLQLAGKDLVTVSLSQLKEPEDVWVGDKVELGIRPEHCQLAKIGDSDENRVLMRVVIIERLGHENFYHTEYQGHKVISRMSSQSLVKTSEGQQAFCFASNKVFVFDPNNGQRR